MKALLVPDLDPPSERPASATGLRLATAHPGLAATVAGVAAGMAVVVACGTFTGSLDRLADDQALVGMTWDVGGGSGSGFSDVDTDRLRPLVAENPALERVTGLSYYGGTVDDVAVPVAVLERVKGSPWPPVVAGRAPVAADEVLVGRATLDTLGIGIGDRISISLSEDLVAFGPGQARVAQSYTVVGSAVAPAVGEKGQDTPKLGIGVLLETAGAVTDLFPDGLPFVDGAATDWFTSATPAEVSQAARSRSVIWFGIGALAVAIVATVMHTLLGSVRQRRREYAVLKAIGFTRRQVRATVLWQSGAILVLALTVAVPVGVAAGRWLWRAFAGNLGIVTDPTVPVLLLGAFVFVTIGVVQGAAMVPASLARRASIRGTSGTE